MGYKGHHMSSVKPAWKTFVALEKKATEQKEKEMMEIEKEEEDEVEEQRIWETCIAMNQRRP